QRYWDGVGPDDADAFRWQDLYRAPLLIVCLSNKKAYLDRYAEQDKGWTDRSEAHWPAPYWDIDTGMAALLMLLTAVDAGLGALFFGVPPEKIATLREAFGIPLELHPIGTVAVGFPKPFDPPSPSLKRGHRPADEVIHRGRWSGAHHGYVTRVPRPRWGRVDCPPSAAGNQKRTARPCGEAPWSAGWADRR